MEILSGLVFVIILIHDCVIGAPPSAEKVVLLDTILDDWRGWSTNTDKYSGWRSQNIPPNGDRVFGLCNVMREKNNNWLYSPIVPIGEANSIIIETFFSMRNCRNYPEPSKLKTCEEKFNMLIFETDEIKESVSPNHKFFKQTSVLFPEKKWSQNEQEQPMMNANKISFPIKTLAIQIGYQDTGSCTMVRRVRVYYLVCPLIVTSFMEFPRTVAKHGYDLASAQGTCVNGAVSKHFEDIQSRFCQSNGMWHEMGVENCHCAPGYTPSTDWKSCIPCAKGSYKPVAGVERCSYCPKNSQSQPGQKRCRCDEEFYQKNIGSGPQMKILCLQPPRAPENLRANVTNGYAVTLTWKFPQSRDSVSRDNIDHFHVSCSNCNMDLLVVSPGVNVTKPSVNIIGLNMGENYLFFVTSVSSVSNYSSSQLLNPTRASVYFSLPKTNGVQMNLPRIDQNDNTTLSIAWARPLDPYVDLYMLQICALHFLNSTKTKQECDYQFTIVPHHIYPFNVRSTSVTVRIRYKSRGVWSEYSPETSIKLSHEESAPPKMEISDRSAETQTIFQWLPNLEVILLFVTSGVLIVILISVSAILMRRHVYRTTKRSDSNILGIDTFIDNTKSSYASITASSPSRGRSYFYLSSVDNSAPQARPLEEIPSNLIILRTLDTKGTFYDTYTACLKQPRKLPLKVTLYALNSNGEINKKLLEDTNEMAQVQHDNIISIIGLCQGDTPPLIVLQNMTHGSLNGFLKRYQSTVDISQLLQFLRDIVCGLCYLADRKVTIKRLTTHTVYIDDCFVCKFSLCFRDLANEIPPRNEIGWTAPELYEQNSYTSASDAWAYGIVVWEVFSFGEQPYWDWSPETVMKSVLEGYRLPQPVICLSVIRDVMVQCWSSDPAQRPLFSTILSRMDVSINYVDDKQILANGNQRFLISADMANHNDCSMTSSMMNPLTKSMMEASMHMSRDRINASLGDIAENKRFYSLKEIKRHSSAKRSKHLENNPETLNGRSPSKSNDSLGRKPRNNNPKSSTLNRHIKGQNVNLNSWLSDINMKKYRRVMLKHGYNNRSKLLNLSIADLTEMGIKRASEIQLLINTIQKLKSEESV